MGKTVALFSYGTLQDPKVQIATYDRLVDCETDALTGYILVDLLIEDARVISLSGKDVHPIARATADPAHRIEGTVLFLTTAELVRSDDYEVEAYERTQVTLESGRRAFIYVEAGKSAR